MTTQSKIAWLSSARRLPIAAATACVASLCAFLVPLPAIADTVQNGCMQNVAGFGLNCNSNDVRIAGVATYPDGSPMLRIEDDGCAFYGDDVTFTATFLVNLGAQARYDIGIYFATDGDVNKDGALTGSCSVTTLDADNTGNFINLDASPDQCGDIDAAHNPLMPAITLTTSCIDVDNNGQLDLPNCVSWRQPGSSTSSPSFQPDTWTWACTPPRAPCGRRSWPRSCDRDPRLTAAGSDHRTLPSTPGRCFDGADCCRGSEGC